MLNLKRYAKKEMKYDEFHPTNAARTVNHQVDEKTRNTVYHPSAAETAVLYAVLHFTGFLTLLSIFNTRESNVRDKPDISLCQTSFFHPNP